MPMRTVVLGEPPMELAALIERRRRLGQDRYDEVWKGEYHMAPAPSFDHARLDDQVARVLGPLADSAGLAGSGPFNLGSATDYRVPDRGYHRGRPHGAWIPTAAIVVEILSQNDETFEKFPFYAEHGADEILVVDLAARSVRWYRLAGAAYEPAAASALLGVSDEWLRSQLIWDY